MPAARTGDERTPLIRGNRDGNGRSQQTASQDEPGFTKWRAIVLTLLVIGYTVSMSVAKRHAAETKFVHGYNRPTTFAKPIFLSLFRILKKRKVFRVRILVRSCLLVTFFISVESKYGYCSKVYGSV